MNHEKFTGLLAETAAMLIGNGANSGRTRRNIERIARAYNFSVQPFFSHSAVVLTVRDNTTGKKKTLVKNIGKYHVNYSVISEISIYSWKILRERPSFEEIERKLHDISAQNTYPEWLRISMIAIATGALSQMFDGGPIDFFTAFLAAVFGFLGRKILLKRNYNSYISWLFGAFVSTSVVNISRRLGVEESQGALTACVLWLIPGVPLINGFLDILEDNVVSGWAKFSMGIMLIFMIAVGFYLSLYLFGYGYTV